MRVDELPIEPGPLEPLGADWLPVPRPDGALLDAARELGAELVGRTLPLDSLRAQAVRAASDGYGQVRGADGAVNDLLRDVDAGPLEKVAHSLTESSGAIQGTAGLFREAENEANRVSLPLSEDQPENAPAAAQAAVDEHFPQRPRRFEDETPPGIEWPEPGGWPRDTGKGGYPEDRERPRRKPRDGEEGEEEEPEAPPEGGEEAPPPPPPPPPQEEPEAPARGPRRGD